ncbi:MAG: hypothetical protein C5B52_00280 [Bacteroidetes bacterium]|nr:MAG: hypothetical protein C5B52_00280 [Bacteroidota bacterium]
MYKPSYKIISLAVTLATLLSISSCRKSELQKPVEAQASLESHPNCSDCEYLRSVYADTFDHPTLLGDAIKNPYLIPNMEQAYYNINGHYPAWTIQPSHIYVKFSPKTYVELASLEDLDLDLFNYPLDRILITEGDYFQQPGKSLEDIPEFFSVVSTSFRLPVNISYEIIDKMYIPDNEPDWENEALRLTNNLNDGAEKENLQSRQRLPEENLPGISSHNNCSHTPSGIIQVQNELKGDKNFRGVRQAQVVVRRLFKIEHLVTDDQGRFSCSKYFRNSYTILVKFKNKYARISRMRPWALHEQLFPIKINFGSWSNLDCAHAFQIDHPNVTSQIFTSHWCAAITQNGVIEHREMLTAEHVGVPPLGLNIMLSSKKGSGNGNTYMINKMMKTSPAVQGTAVLIISSIALWSPIGAGLSLIAEEVFTARAPDIKFGYGGDASFLTTDRYCELVYHELSHAAHYAAVGNNWWMRLGIAENDNPGEGTYGNCCTVYAPSIALAEGWAYYMGHHLADKKWGMLSTSFPEQGDLIRMQNLVTFRATANFSSHVVFLESYQPHKKDDPNAWIPKGLLYDLVDSSTELFPQSGIIDEVSGFTNEELYKALQPDVKDIFEYKHKLLIQNNFRQQQAVNELFKEYGY